MAKNLVPKTWDLQTAWDGRRYSDPDKVPIEPGPDPGEGPNYTPARLLSFEGGSLNTPAQGPNGLVWAVSNTQYSDDVAGPLGGNRVCRIEGQNAGGTSFGGGLVSPGVRPSEGSDCWVRIWHYFPDDFCFRNNGGEDHWGQTKWIRFQWGTDGGARFTFQIGNFSPSACNTYGIMWGASDEGLAGVDNRLFPNQLQIPRGGWRCLEWHVHFSTEPDVGYIEGWVGDEHTGLTRCVTMPPTSLALTEIIYGDYYNGGYVANNPWYIAEGIITFETPDAVDSSGRPRIGPTRAVGDFA